MVIAKLKYQRPRLTVLGTAREVLLSEAKPEIREAVRMLGQARHRSKPRRDSAAG